MSDSILSFGLSVGRVFSSGAQSTTAAFHNFLTISFTRQLWDSTRPFTHEINVCVTIIVLSSVGLENLGSLCSRAHMLENLVPC